MCLPNAKGDWIESRQLLAKKGGSTSIALMEVVRGNKRLVTTQCNLLPSSWSCLLENVTEALGGFQVLFAAPSFPDHLPDGGGCTAEVAPA